MKLIQISCRLISIRVLPVHAQDGGADLNEGCCLLGLAQVGPVQQKLHPYRLC